MSRATARRAPQQEQGARYHRHVPAAPGVRAGLRGTRQAPRPASGEGNELRRILDVQHHRPRPVAPHRGRPVKVRHLQADARAGLLLQQDKEADLLWPLRGDTLPRRFGEHRSRP